MTATMMPTSKKKNKHFAGVTDDIARAAKNGDMDARNDLWVACIPVAEYAAKLVFQKYRPIADLDDIQQHALSMFPRTLERWSGEGNFEDYLVKSFRYAGLELYDRVDVWMKDAPPGERRRPSSLDAAMTTKNDEGDLDETKVSRTCDARLDRVCLKCGEQLADTHCRKQFVVCNSTGCKHWYKYCQTLSDILPVVLDMLRDRVCSSTELADAIGLSSIGFGKISTMLTSLGYVLDRWRQSDYSSGKRSNVTYYRLTAEPARRMGPLSSSPGCQSEC